MGKSPPRLTTLIAPTAPWVSHTRLRCARVPAPALEAPGPAPQGSPHLPCGRAHNSGSARIVSPRISPGRPSPRSRCTYTRRTAGSSGDPRRGSGRWRQAPQAGTCNRPDPRLGSPLEPAVRRVYVHLLLGEGLPGLILGETIRALPEL